MTKDTQQQPSDFQKMVRRMYQKAYDFAAMVARMQNK